jgi:hypothetical protein
MSRSIRRKTSAAAILLVIALAVGACSGDEDEPRESAPTPSATPAPTVETQVSVGEVTGKLSRAKRAQVTRKVSQVVDGWMGAAYLSGDYPRTNFRNSWPGFTPGARAQAQHDRALMSNQALGRRIDGVQPQRREVRIDVLAARQRPVGVTAHVALRFKTTGKVERGYRISGRLYLTHTDNGWRIFGYDISKAKSSGGAR